MEKRRGSRFESLLGAVGLSALVGGGVDAQAMPTQETYSIESGADAMEAKVAAHIESLVFENRGAVTQAEKMLPEKGVDLIYYSKQKAQIQKNLEAILKEQGTGPDLEDAFFSETSFNQDEKYIHSRAEDADARTTLLVLRLARVEAAINIIVNNPELHDRAGSLIMSVMEANKPADLSVKGAVSHSGFLFGVSRSDQSRLIEQMKDHPISTPLISDGEGSPGLPYESITSVRMAFGAGALEIPMPALDVFKVRNVANLGNGEYMALIDYGIGCEGNLMKIKTNVALNNSEMGGYEPVQKYQYETASEALAPSNQQQDKLAGQWIDSYTGMRGGSAFEQAPESTRRAPKDAEGILAEDAEGILADVRARGMKPHPNRGKSPFALARKGKSTSITFLSEILGGVAKEVTIRVDASVDPKEYPELIARLNELHGSSKAARAKIERSRPPTPVSGKPKATTPAAGSFMAYAPLKGPSGQGGERLVNGLPVGGSGTGGSLAQESSLDSSAGETNPRVYFKQKILPRFAHTMRSEHGVGYRFVSSPESNSGSGDAYWEPSERKVMSAISRAESDPVVRRAVQQGFQWNTIVFTRSKQVADNAITPTIYWINPGDSLTDSLHRALEAQGYDTTVKPTFVRLGGDSSDSKIN